MSKNYEKEYMNKNLLEKTSYFCQTIYNTGKFYCNVVPNLFVKPNEKYSKIIYPNKSNSYDKIEWNNSSDGLIIVIHGLLGSPKTLGYEIAKKISFINDGEQYQIKKYYDVILPIIPFGGNCDLVTASKPLYELILDYIYSTDLTNSFNKSKKYKSKPIHLISCSNGCRIASWIECELRNININIKLTCIAGAFGGSIVIDKFDWILGIILDKNIIKDLATNSDTNSKLVKKINSELVLGSRDYEFYGTANDWYIPNFNDCFPVISKLNLNKNNFTIVYHELKYGYDHVSLGWYLADEIISNSIKWMENVS